MKTILLTLLSVAAVAVFGLLAVAYSGAVDVAAVSSHSEPVEWLLETILHSSIERRSARIEVPSLDDPGYVASGLVHYQEMCVTCHGAPGIERSETGRGLNPPPPDFAGQSPYDEKELAEAFWVIKNGIRMTGMPAYGDTHDDETIWGMVALLRDLPSIAADEYAARVAGAGLSARVGGHHHAEGEDQDDGTGSAPHVDPPGAPPHQH